MQAHARRLSEDGLDDELVALGGHTAGSQPRRFASNPSLAALRRAGTKHIYAASADTKEIDTLVNRDGRTVQEINGSTSNQRLLRQVVDGHLTGGAVAEYAKRLRLIDSTLTADETVGLIYTILNGCIANNIVSSLASGRPWDISLQLHMQLPTEPDAAKRIGRVLRRMVPSAVIKVPFLPHAPQCLLVARDLENEGIPVNLTSTFSARQVVVGGLFANVTLTNIFTWRLNHGLKAELLGEHVDLCAQRWLTQLRRTAAIKTELTVAGLRDWRTFVHVAGCDGFTSPCGAIRSFMEQRELAPEQITSQLDTSYEDRLGVAPDVDDCLGTKGIARTYKVEPELIQFLSEFRATREFAALRDGDDVFRHFDRAGFGDFFYSPTPSQWQEMGAGNLPQLDSPLTARLPIDTLFTLLADADFEKSQEDIDRLIRQAI